MTEYEISGEYGSASEGALQLSADGQSLTILGYGVNYPALRNNGAAVYGNAALGSRQHRRRLVDGRAARRRRHQRHPASSTVPRRSPAFSTTTIRVASRPSMVPRSGFPARAAQRATTRACSMRPTAPHLRPHQHATDTRIAEIYDDQLYVSADCKQGATSISTMAPSGLRRRAASTPERCHPRHRHTDRRDGNISQRSADAPATLTSISAPRISSSPIRPRSMSPTAAIRKTADSATAACRSGPSTARSGY